jgi:hypothetical protein
VLIGFQFVTISKLLMQVITKGKIWLVSKNAGFTVHPAVSLMAQGIYTRPKAWKVGADTTLDYNRREAASNPRCMQTFLRQDA